jgi:hypothetical protein
MSVFRLPDEQFLTNIASISAIVSARNGAFSHCWLTNISWRTLLNHLWLKFVLKIPGHKTSQASHDAEELPSNSVSVGQLLKIPGHKNIPSV